MGDNTPPLSRIDSLVATVDQHNAELDELRRQFALIVLGCLSLTILVAVLTWRTSVA